MIVRNPYTGALHEVPDQQLYEAPDPVYDGFGNPVGGIFNRLARGARSLLRAPANAANLLMNPAGAAAGNLVGNLLPQPAGMPLAGPRPPWPAGWVRPPLPYTGLGPKRLYMRCAVWPGPQGLAPNQALSMQQQIPGIYPGVPAAPGAPAFSGGRRSRRRRR